MNKTTALMKSQDENEKIDALNVETNEREFDPFKDTLLRYLGYTNEFGEAFRPLIPKWVVLST